MSTAGFEIETAGAKPMLDFRLYIPPYGLQAPVTIAVDAFDPDDLPAAMQPPQPQARRANHVYDKFRFASDIITLNPDATK